VFGDDPIEAPDEVVEIEHTDHHLSDREERYVTEVAPMQRCGWARALECLDGLSPPGQQLETLPAVNVERRSVSSTPGSNRSRIARAMPAGSRDSTPMPATGSVGASLHRSSTSIRAWNSGDAQIQGFADDQHIVVALNEQAVAVGLKPAGVRLEPAMIGGPVPIAAKRGRAARSAAP
jgi:hypothetical protein